jgi:hypothetical protein
VLPTTLRIMWSEIILLGDRIKPPHFFDYTKELANFLDRIETNTLGTLGTGININCFPKVKCPLGCWEWPDYCDMISFADYIAYAGICQLPGTNPELFRAARPD